jgi:peptide/nickel transport system substrate-binding protein
VTKILSSGLTRRQLMKWAGAATSGAVIASTVGGFARPALAQGANQITIAIPNDPQGLDPLAIEAQIPAQVTWNIYEPLLWRDKKGAVIPWLAESFEYTGPTTAVLKLRSGVKFHNGEALNADSAAFSINRIIDPATKSQWIGTVNTIVSAKALDDLTVEVTTSEPDPILQARMTVIAMMAPGWTKEVGDQVNVQANGTGPFKLVNWARNISIELAANEDYWGNKPTIGTVLYRVIPEDATRYQSVRTKEIDLYLGLLADQVSSIGKYAAGVGQDFSFFRLSNIEGTHIGDPRIRQAMNYAVDKEGIRAALYAGLGEPLRGQLSSPQMYGFNDALSAYPYDPEKASSLLAEAGGVGLHITLEGPKGRYTGDAVELQAVAAMLEAVGLHVDLVLRDPNSWVRVGDRVQTPVPPDGWYVRHTNTLFDADRTLASYYTLQGSYSSYSNPKVDEAFEASRKELDAAKRLELLKKCYEIGSVEDPMGLFMFQHVDLWGMTDRVEFEPDADGLLRVNQIRLTA